MTDHLDRRGFLQGTAALGGIAALASVPAEARSPDLTAGAARRDITPENGGEFFGYVRPDIRADGVSIRLFAHALVLDDGDRKVALVSADLGAPGVREQVLEHVRPLGFDRDTVLFAATHTHAGPFDRGEWIAAQVGDAIAAADEARQPARAGWGTTDVFDANQSRSVEAHLANHGQDHPPGFGSPDLDPKGPNHVRDTTLRLLRVEALDGTPLAAWTQYAVHPTAFTPHNTTFSADLSGAATRRFVAGFEGEAPLAMYTNGTEGDLIPVYDDYNQHAVADREGARVARGMREAWADAGDRLGRSLPVDGVATVVTYQGQEVGDGHRVARAGFWGVPTYGGGKNGPTIFYEADFKGKRRPKALADPVHGRKILGSPAPYSPEVELQALRVGDRLLLGLAGEPTTQVGRRIADDAAAVAPEGIEDISVVGVANGYNGYFTTPEEYGQQHYEGGHTVFGKYSSLLVRETHRALAGELAEGPSEPPEPSGSAPADPAPPTGNGSAEGALTAGPGSTVERMGVATLSWTGSRLGTDRPVDEPFLVLEREQGSGWERVATDLGLGFVWREDPLGSGEYTARYDVPPGLPTGEYRIRVRGPQYELTTDPFAVVPSTGLRPRGVRLDGEGASRLVLVAQNPPPDPETNLRTRAAQPTGGTATLLVDGTAYGARWDPEAAGWVTTAAVPGVAEGDPVTLPESGLVDGLDNRSGASTELTVGEVADVEWPPAIGPGGGKPPGPAGVGTFPP